MLPKKYRFKIINADNDVSYLMDQKTGSQCFRKHVTVQGRKGVLQWQAVQETHYSSEALHPAKVDR